MGPTLVLVRDPTAARPLLLLLLLSRHATVARPVLQLPLLLLLRHATTTIPVLLRLVLLPRHATAARYHIVIPSLDSDSHGPPVPTTTTDDKSMGVRWTFRELAENELNNF